MHFIAFVANLLLVFGVTEGYLLPLCSKNGGVCDENLLPQFYALQFIAEAPDEIPHFYASSVVNYYHETLRSLWVPLSSILDEVTDKVTSSMRRLYGEPAPRAIPKSLLVNIMNWFGYNTPQEVQPKVNINLDVNFLTGVIFFCICSILIMYLYRRPPDEPKFVPFTWDADEEAAEENDFRDGLVKSFLKFEEIRKRCKCSNCITKRGVCSRICN